MARTNLTPAWMLGSICVMSPVRMSLPVAGITCMTPIAPTGLRAALADHPGDVAAGPNRGPGVRDELGEDLLPEIGDVVLDDGRLDEAGVHHLEDVLVLEILGRQPNLDLRLARLAELLVELLD